MSQIGRIAIDRYRREILQNALLLLRKQCSARQKTTIDELLGELIQDDWQERHKQERVC